MNELVRYEAARLAVEKCAKVDEAKEIENKASCLKAYARQSKDPELYRWIAEIELRARRRIGELSAALDKHQGTRTELRPGVGTKLKVATLADAGISKSEAHRCEHIAKVPAADFERVLAEKQKAGKPVTADDVLRFVIKRAKQQRPKEKVLNGRETCCQVSDLRRLADGEIKFGTVYADPPWQYGNQATRAATGDHYVGMSLDEICALPVALAAAENAHLHLWTTNAFLFDAKRVIESWGFSYRSCYVWVKPQIGMGNYWRVSHEFLLLGVRGSAPFLDKSLSSWGQFPRRKHSSKPEEIRKLIERAGVGPRLELFARRQSPGWHVWGNEIERALFDSALEEAA